MAFQRPRQGKGRNRTAGAPVNEAELELIYERLGLEGYKTAGSGLRATLLVWALSPEVRALVAAKRAELLTPGDFGLRTEEAVA